MSIDRDYYLYLPMYLHKHLPVPIFTAVPIDPEVLSFHISTSIFLSIYIHLPMSLKFGLF